MVKTGLESKIEKKYEFYKGETEKWSLYLSIIERFHTSGCEIFNKIAGALFLRFVCNFGFWHLREVRIRFFV